MNDEQRDYAITLDRPIDVFALSLAGPFALAPGVAPSQFTVRTDQAGLIGLLRLLHNRGIGLAAVVRESEAALTPTVNLERAG